MHSRHDRARVVVGADACDRIVEDDVHATVPIDQLRGGVAGGVGAGDVGDLAADPGAATGQGGDGPGEPVEVAAGEVDGVRGSQALGRSFDQGQAQALGGAGDQNDLQTAVTALT